MNQGAGALVRMILAAVIFVGAFAGIATEKVHRTVVALGACLGGNGTLIGASANVIISGIGEKHGFPLGFRRFTMYGLPLMLESMLISTAYVWLRYFL